MVGPIKIEIKLTVEQMSKTFASMNSTEQACFLAETWKHMEYTCGGDVRRATQCANIREAIAKQPAAQALLAELREPEPLPWDHADSAAIIIKAKVDMFNYTLLEMRTIAAKELGPNCVQLFDPKSTEHYFARSATLFLIGDNALVQRYRKGPEGEQQTVVLGRIVSYERDAIGNGCVSVRKFAQNTPVVHMNIVTTYNPKQPIYQRTCCDTPEGAWHKDDCVEVLAKVKAHFDSSMIDTPPCPDCNGTGEIQLLSSFVKCERCQK